MTCSASTSETSAVGDLVVVCKNGEFVSLSGENLAVHWSASSKSTVQDVVAAQIEDFEVDFVTSGTRAEFSEGIFKDRPEVFSALPKSPTTEPELLYMVLRSVSQGQESRHSVVLAAAPGKVSGSDLPKLAPLEIVPIHSVSSKEVVTYQVDVQGGLLFQLHKGSLTVYDLTTAVPKLKSVVQMDKAMSFSRLSRPFILSCSLESIGLYNYQYRSIHANASLDLSEVPVESQNPRSCQFITYLRSQDLAVALVDNVLVSIQVEPPKSHGKRRKHGLLIDSIGRGTTVTVSSKKVKSEKASEFSRQLPGTMTEDYVAVFDFEVETADKLSRDDFAEWEALLRKKFRMALKSASGAIDGPKANGQEDSDSQELPEWEWLPNPSSYTEVDRRWVTYAISRVFTISDEKRPVLQLLLTDSNVTSYLIVAGHLTISNIKAAFRAEFDAEALDSKLLASDLLSCLTDADPSMTLVLNYLQATKLGETEILLAIRALMLNLDLMPTSKPDVKKLLQAEAHDETKDHEMDVDVDVDLDALERDIAITEFFLGDESSNRSLALTLAFIKLGRLPALTTVKALRAILKMEEILSLIFLLRVELVRGAWTSLYVDPTSFDSEGNEAPPDGAIALIADLLGRCIDAIGAGGWLFNDAITRADDTETGDFLSTLRLEVTAALEGLEEAVYLNGVVGEAVRFGVAAQKGGAGRASWNTNKPIAMQLENRETRLLPLGLKAKQLPTKDKVVSGGEVVQRSMRETGHLISQKVEAYSLEKLAI